MLQPPARNEPAWPTPVELSKTHSRHVGVFESSPSDWVKDANRREKRDGFARCGEQLLDGLLVVSGFSQYLIVEYGELISADD